ncbi:MAG: imidazoleglycerol-phosphate dehydratase [Alectoria fallacina]|uniref:Imidazoleglycerol-phosphate dehydratase n=1 Tax=Alectoria fallacina TaxID=1903189 RepID=A0A8H3IH58_9LECA|nr:MAG: imidazoleglycerol-phosphate dehydratase [Alectoria fallacina]
MSNLPSRRTALINRNTNETKIQVSLSLDGGPIDPLPDNADFSAESVAPNAPVPSQTTNHHASQLKGSQQIWIWTGIGFLDHMLHAWSKHAVDDHHTTEDTLLALGTAFTTALGPRTGLARFGHCYAPLDEALSRAVLDISSRPFFVGNFDFDGPMIGQLNSQMVHHGLSSWAMAAGVTLHVDVIRGSNDHHKAESAFKALAGACKMACARIEGREGEVGSTKGVL